ncbi:UvrD-helicase domain-containing protein [Candidatus Poribacteria bacterium]|jgi:DNA helicase II / ATP-dependent DNA helicase PcrA|nr:UvrD-helicase domain-containing protein [Candidatus Poribacteria bacterium]MBT5536865.1 UvrD-helicase domain-containing protein [Candidatus Poribacteria bacterium]MBT5709475.1 UvrD-helicase domain-containing protein [Candidatus Poribacteria bacterium]MBT7097732.1 UvrD-helicase domain-containing protein [Candidatus Poribacteria bacterium]MBT7808352.1 UvrD-helicase domain-containing protein [Candidatus Poribacteria bacterium]
MALLDSLNDAQRDAVLHTDGPLLLLAGAGSGKTRALMYRIAHLIQDQGVDARSILAVTFTNKAAEEMKGRLEQIVGPRSRDIWARTFHATCAQLLRWDIEALGGYTRGFTIFDSSDQVALMKRVLLDLNIGEQKLDARSVLSAVGRAKNELMGPQQHSNAATNYYEEQVGKIYDAYQKRLVDHNALDFDDLIVLTVRLFEEHPAILEKYQDRWRYVHVDEYQDTNHSQYTLTRMLAAKRSNICVVGDDDQSIYSWRGADIRNILDFERDYPKTTVIHLDQNYRCTQNILAAAQEVVRFNRRRRPKQLFTQNSEGSLIRYFEAFDERTEADFVAEQIATAHENDGTAYGRHAVFYRINAQSRNFEESLRHRNIPYQIIGSVRFYERAEVKDILAYLRVLVNPRDELSLLRVINTPARGIGKTTLERLRAYATDNRLSVLDAIAQVDDIGALGTAPKRNLGKFHALLQSIDIAKPVSEVVEDLLERTGYLKGLRERGRVEDDARLENLAELVTATAEYQSRAENPTASGYLESVTLASDLDSLVDASEMVTLMTLHSAKGLEFPVVFLTGMEEGLFPHQRALAKELELEEERRLCYVGMTRAMSDLYLTRARVRRIHGYAQETLRSRFLDEVPQHLVEELDSWGAQESYGSRSTAWNKGGFSRLEKAAPKSAAPTRRRSRPADPKPRPKSVSTFDASPQTDGEMGFLRVSARVAHASFGKGEVMSVEGAGDNMRVTVKFDDAGPKSLLVAFAKLEPVG